MIDNLHDFFNKGYQVFDGQKYYDNLKSLLHTTKFDNYTGDENHPSNNKDLIEILLLQNHLQIAEDIIEKYFSNYEIGRRMIWESVNKKAMLWHNDLNDHTNTFFLLYHNDTNSNIGGSVNFRYKNIEEKIYPKAGTLIFFNCLNNFEHKAENSKQQRIVSSYYFNINYGPNYKTY